MKRKLLSILLATGLVLSLAACGSSDDADSSASGSQDNADVAFDDYARPVITDDVSVIYLVSNLTDESNIRCENQAQVEAAHRGWDYQCINYESEDSFREYFQNAISQNPTAIIIGVTQAFDSYQDLVAQARDAGIGVYSNDNSVIDGVISNATMDNAAASTMLMDQLAADYPDGLDYCVFQLEMSEVVTLRADAAMAYADDKDNFTVLDHIDLASTGDLNTAGYTVGQTFLQSYGDDLDCIICNADTPALSAAEAIIQAGDETGEKTFVTGVDGGSSTWAYIRSGSPLKYTYSQPFEYYTHMTFEVINDIQVKGLNPGDDGCTISEVGEYITADGIVTTVDNCPQAGDSIHSVFDYYGGDPDDADAWYSWNDGPGVYEVTE